MRHYDIYDNVTTMLNLRQQLKKDNKKRPEILTQVPESKWPSNRESKRIKVWISKKYLVQEFIETDAIRITINRTTINKDNNWNDKISWDELQNIKNEIGYGNHYAIEIYPPDHDVINVANMRHIWVLDQPLAIGWKN